MTRSRSLDPPFTSLQLWLIIGLAALLVLTVGIGAISIAVEWPAIPFNFCMGLTIIAGVALSDVLRINAISEFITSNEKRTRQKTGDGIQKIALVLESAGVGTHRDWEGAIEELDAIFNDG